MKEEIQRSLKPLIGTPLWASGRAADLEWFQFGQRRTVTAGGRTKEVGDYSLHIQCAWRIRHGDRVVVGSRDLYNPPQESDDLENFDGDVQGANRRDKGIAELFQNGTREFRVRDVEVGEAGAFTIRFDDGYALDVFPDDSLSGEHWRIFRPSADEPHFVVNGEGLES
jgi:hypothetical protein